MRELFQMDRQNYHPEGKVYKRPSARAVILKWRRRQDELWFRNLSENSES